MVSISASESTGLGLNHNVLIYSLRDTSFSEP